MELRRVASLLLATTMMFASRLFPTSAVNLYKRYATTIARTSIPNNYHFRLYAPSQRKSGCTRLASSKKSDDANQAGSSSSLLSPQYIKSYRLNGVGEGSRVDITTDTGHRLATDVPKKMGGHDSAPQPVETLLAAWAGCTQATASFVGRQMRSVEHPRGIKISRLEFDDIHGVRDERGALDLPIGKIPEVPSRLQRITGTIRVVTRHPLEGEQLHLLKEQTEARCPVANMILASGCTIDMDWVSVSTE